MIYSVKKVLEEMQELEYNDGIKTIFLYTGRKYGGNQAMKNLLPEWSRWNSFLKELRNSRKCEQYDKN